MTVPSFGDILNLSQAAWRIGRAFTSNRKDVPAGFRSVEEDVSGLTRALTQLAETLQTEANTTLLSKSDQTTQDCIALIFSSCQRTIHDLDSLVDRYQVIRKRRTDSGFAIERSWSDLVLTQHETVTWTTEGGNMHDLSSLLQMHTKSMQLLAEAVKSGSLARLERVVAPMAERFESMYDLPGSLEDQLDEVSRFVRELTLASPVQAPPIPQRNPARSPTAEMSDPLSATSVPLSPPPLSSRRPSAHASTSFSRQRAVSGTSVTSGPPSTNASPLQHLSTTDRTPKHVKDSIRNKEIQEASNRQCSHLKESCICALLANQTQRTSDLAECSASGRSRKGAVLTGDADCWATLSPHKRVSEFSYGGSSVRDSSGSYASSTSSVPSRASLTHPHALTSATESMGLPFTPELREIPPSTASFLTLLPPPMMRPPSSRSEMEASRGKSKSTLSPFPTRQDSITKLHRSSTTASQKAAFEKDAFRNSAVLCDVRGNLVEYSQHTHPDPAAPEDIADIEMVPACASCRIAVVRKRITSSPPQSVHMVTSIWALSDDNTVRMELRLEEAEMYIPYSSYFSPAKTSITVPCTLRFHDVKFGTRILRSARSSWVNFSFTDAQGAALFQNEIMGRTLLATFRTVKTMRIHEGALASFAYAEQMCALENLRVWEDTDTGAVIALIHFSASFRDGYLAFYLNSGVNTVKVQDVGGREVKIKGLRVPIAETVKAMRKDSVVDDTPTSTTGGSWDADAPHCATGKASSRSSPSAARKKGKDKDKEKQTVETVSSSDRKKVISGARIEFASEEEKSLFLGLVGEYQRPGRLCEVPDLLGVN